MKQAAKFLIPLLIVAPSLTYTLWHLKQQKATPPKLANTMITQQEIIRPESPIPGAIPAQSLYQLLAAELALDRELPEVALANYIAAAKETQDPQVAARATQIALTTASLEDAVEPASIWARHAPQDLEAQVTAAAILIRLNKVNEAVPYLRQAQNTNTDEAFQYFLVLYKQLQNENDLKQVVAALEQLAAEKSQHIAAKLALSEIYLYQGQSKKALEFVNQALAISPDSSLGIQLKSECLLRVEDKQKAKAYLDSIMPTVSNLQLQQYYTQFLFENGYQEEAHKQIKTLANNPKLSAEDQVQFARFAMQSQWYDIAEQFLKRASKNTETQDLSFYFLGRVYEELNKTSDAITAYQQVVAGPFHVLSQLRASVLLAERKQYDQALAVLSRTQASDEGQQKQVVLAQVEILNQANRYEESLKVLTEANKMLPDDTELLYAKGIVADHLNKIELAEASLKNILALKTNHVDALNALGYILINKTQRHEEARQFLNEALKLAPNNPSVLDSLGWYYYKKGDYAQALHYLKKASEISRDPEIAAHLGEVMWRMKDFEGAKRVWNSALQNHPKHELVLKAMDRMMTQKAR